MLDAVLARLKDLHPRLIDLGLGRVEELLAALGNPERRLPPVVHVAGTNGKGSTVAALRAIAEAAGLVVHVYTSPHLVRFAERIRVAGSLIADEALTALLEECEAANAGRPVTVFEITTAAAFLAFARTPADLCLLETGLGGRLDATNVIARPALTVLTPVSMDHEAFLGDSLAAIAAEKAGILKPATPAVVAAQADKAAATIAERARQLGAPLLLEGRDWTATATADGLRLTTGGRVFELPPPALRGPHQIGNAGLAAMASLTLPPPFRIGEAALAAGLRRIEWPARLQRLAGGRLARLLPEDWELWLDGGHNPAAGEALADSAAMWADRPLDLIVGMLTTKDAAGFLRPLARRARRLRTVAIPGEASSVPAEKLAATARACGHAAAASDSVAAALGELATGPGPARALICGSLYLAGAVLREDAAP